MAAIRFNQKNMRVLVAEKATPALMRKAEAILQEARANLQKSTFTGELAASLRIVQRRRGDEFIISIGTDLPYWKFVHDGTGPQHIPNPREAYTPPWNKPEFQAWALEHGIPPFVLAQHISLFGTKPNPFLRDAIEAAKRA